MDSSKNDRDGAIGPAGTSIEAVSAIRAIAHQRGVTREVGALLIVSGIAGILLPGPVGTPLLVLGCVMIWPKAFERVNHFLAKQFPKTHHLGACQSARFLSDLERRYPASR